MQKIFIVEDDENICDMVSYALTSSGFETKVFSNGEDFWDNINNDIPSLILLDIMLPGQDGISILQTLRKSNVLGKIPVILVTAKGSEYDKIKGLDLGADDYITKPFSVMELISRIKAVLRRSDNFEEKSVISVGDIELDPSKRTVTVGKDEVSLTFKEFELLQYLMENKGMVLTREKLLNTIWGYDYIGETRTVDMHIGTLRKKLGNSGDIIITIRNVGYKIGE